MVAFIGNSIKDFIEDPNRTRVEVTSGNGCERKIVDDGHFQQFSSAMLLIAWLGQQAKIFWT